MAGWEIIGNATGKSLLALLNGDGAQGVQARPPQPISEAGRALSAPIACDPKKLWAEFRARRGESVKGHSFDKAPWTLGATTPTSCPANSTCMVTAFSNTGLGCCIGHGTKAVACPDHVHCCPEGWTCSGHCRLGGCACVPPAA